MTDYIVQNQRIDVNGVVEGKEFPITLTEAVYDGATKKKLTDTLAEKADKTDIPTVPTKTSELTNDSGFAKMWFGTQDEYDALTTKEPGTVYNIVEKQA